MDVKLINRGRLGPQFECVTYARQNGFELQRQPFGRRGSLVEVYRSGEDCGYRKSYAAALLLMKRIVEA